jgi:hypothetical protein
MNSVLIDDILYYVAMTLFFVCMVMFVRLQILEAKWRKEDREKKKMGSEPR